MSISMALSPIKTCVLGVGLTGFTFQLYPHCCPGPGHLFLYFVEHIHDHPTPHSSLSSFSNQFTVLLSSTSYQSNRLSYVTQSVAQRAFSLNMVLKHKNQLKAMSSVRGIFEPGDGRELESLKTASRSTTQCNCSFLSHLLAVLIIFYSWPSDAPGQYIDLLGPLLALSVIMKNLMSSAQKPLE
jgi:hypothetical protein